MWMDHRMGYREGAEAEGRSSSGRAQCPGQFLFQTEGTRNSVKDWEEWVTWADLPLGKIPFPFCGEVIVEGLGFLVERQLKEKADAVIQGRRDGEWSRLWPGRRLHTTQLHWAGRGVYLHVCVGRIFPQLVRAYSVFIYVIALDPSELGDDGSHVIMPFPLYRRWNWD